MKTNNKLKKIYQYKLLQEKLRDKAINKGVNLIAPDTIFLSKDTIFGKNVTIEPYVVIGSKVKIGDRSHINLFPIWKEQELKKMLLSVLTQD